MSILLDFYQKHPKLLMITFVFAVIGLFSFVMTAIRILLLVEYCFRNPMAQPGIENIFCQLINQLK